MKGSARACLLLCMFILCLSLGCSKPAPPPPENTPPATVKWEGALDGALDEWTELTGTTTPLPDRIAHVSAPVEGPVQSVLGDAANKRIDKGAVLAQLDTTIVQANLARLEAGKEVAKEEEKQAQYALELATSDVERLSQVESRLVPSADRQKADVGLKDAQSKLRAAKGRLVSSEKEEIALRAQLKLFTITSPIPGRVGRIQVAPGQALSVGTLVAEVVDIDEKIEVLCFVPGRMLRRFQVGQPAYSGPLDKDPTAPEPEATGEIVSIADQAEPETGNFLVKVRFENKDAHLRSNLVIRIHIRTQEGKECLSLPQAAVSEDEETPTVVIVEAKTEKNADGKEETVYTARRLQAVLGRRDRLLHQIEIVSLADPDKEAKQKWQGDVKDQQFVVEGGQGLQTGDRVKLDVDTGD